MRDRRPIVAAVLGLALLGATPTSRPIDVAKSHASFSIAHIWVERVKGTVPIVAGSVTLAPGSTIPTSATAVFDAARIATDEPDRDRALESPDFFDAAKFPTWTFTSTKIVAKRGNEFEMDGDLTLHGVTQPEKLNVTVSGSVALPVYHAVGQIDRRAFGMAITRLDPTIGTTADITIDVTLQ